MGDIAFPASIMALKFFCKLFVDQQVKWLDAGKAILAFPIDIVFLSLSFGSALLYATPANEIQNNTIKSMFLLLALCFSIALLTTALCKKSDAALTQNNYWTCGFLFLCSYTISMISLFGALGVRRLIG